MTVQFYKMSDTVKNKIKKIEDEIFRNIPFLIPIETKKLNLIKNNEKQTSEYSPHSVSVWIAFALIAVLSGLCGLVFVIDGILPTPLYLADEETYPDAFITQRAQHDLETLSDIGPREAGSFNSYRAANFLIHEITSIIEDSHVNHKIELDIQKVRNFENIVVKLHGKTNASLLINAHFDTVLQSPGGSDGGINCVVMLEILRKITQNTQIPLNNIIFLFNGGEELGFLGSRGFIIGHKWARESKVVINLEAIGAGGKIILFQVGPEASWLLDYYKKVPHPYGQAAADEIFENNIFPLYKDDFKNFVHNGFVGLDMAFFKDGYRFHTEYDGFDNIPLGSYQHVGDNTLSLVKSLGNAPEVANPNQNFGNSVYFDFLGLFMISYTNTVAIVVNSIVGGLSIAIFVLSVRSLNLAYNTYTLLYLVMSFGAIIGGWILAGIFTYILALFIDAIGYSMSWYFKPVLVFGLYGVPTIAFQTLLLQFLNLKDFSPSVKAQIQAHCVRIIWTIIMIIGTILNIRSMYILLVPVLFNTSGFIIIYLFKLQHTIRKWQVIYVISLIIPTMCLIYETILAFTFFIPITGRKEFYLNSEVFIGIIGFVCTLLITSPFLALSTLVRKFKYVLYFLISVFLIKFLIIFTTLRTPWRDNNSHISAAEKY